MGRFDEWFAEDASRANKESDHDSTQRETPASVEADAGSVPEHGNAGSDSFSILEEQPAAEADSHDDFPDSNGGLTPDAGESDIAILPSSLAGREPTPQLKARYNGHKAFNDQIRSDWMLIIESSPDAFQALLVVKRADMLCAVTENTVYIPPAASNTICHLFIPFKN